MTTLAALRALFRNHRQAWTKAELVAETGKQLSSISPALIAHPIGLLRVPSLISPYAHNPCVIVEAAKGFDSKLWTGRMVWLRHFHIKRWPNVQLKLPL